MSCDSDLQHSVKSTIQGAKKWNTPVSLESGHETSGKTGYQTPSCYGEHLKAYSLIYNFIVLLAPCHKETSSTMQMEMNDRLSL